MCNWVTMLYCRKKIMYWGNKIKAEKKLSLKLSSFYEVKLHKALMKIWRDHLQKGLGTVPRI